MSLFNMDYNTIYRLHSGQESFFKIDCDALSDEDIRALALLIADRVAFSEVVGVPRGGLRLAEALECFAIPMNEPVLLIVDDVLTTGGSMEAWRAGRDAIGFVIFARGDCPSWVKALFTLAT